MTEPKEIKPGDVVTLKGSTITKMTVEGVSEGCVNVVWLDLSGHMQRNVVPKAALIQSSELLS